MLDDNKAVSFARNTSLTEDEVKAISGVKRIDITADQEKAFGRIYGWVEGDNFYWWSNCEYGCLTDDTREIFNDLSNLTQMDLKYVDTSEMTNMNSMFANDENLTTLTNIEDFDTSHVTNMERMFYRCGVQTLDLTTWDVSNVESFSYMFANTSNFQELDITGWDMSGCKYYCKTKGKYGTMEFGSNSSNYEGEYVGGYKGEAFYYAGDQKNGFHVIANNVTFPGDSNMMFWNSYVSQIDMENVDLSQVVTMHWFLGSCGKLKEVSISNATDTKNLRYINYCFDSCSNLTNVTLSGFDTSENLLNASYMFKFDSALTSLTQDLNTQSARILNSMFYYCRNITELDLSNFDTSSIGKADDLNETYTGGLALMVIGCSQLKKLNISNWDLSSTTGKLEYDKNGIITYGTNDFITSIGDPYATDLIVTANNMVLPECVGSLFYDLGPAQVEMNNTDFSHVVYLGSLFHGSYSNNTKLKKFDISGFGAKNIKTLKYTFGCMPNVKALDLTWLESAPTNTTSMFEGDSSLTTIYVSKNFDMSKVNISSDMFYNCSSLKNFDSTKTDATNANTSSTGYFTLKE